MSEKEKLKPEQEKAINHDQGNLLLSASAGSGKTFVMIKRIIRLVTEGKANVNQIVAVTFTEASAKDIKEKLKRALIEEYNKTHNENLIVQLNDVPTADISTLHSFCMRLIKKYFYVAEISPDFKIVDANEAGIIKNNCMDLLFRECYENPTEQFKLLCDRHFSKRSDYLLRKILFRGYEFADSEANPQEFYWKSYNFYNQENLEIKVKELTAFKLRQIELLKEDFVLKNFQIDKDKYPKLFATAKLFEEMLDGAISSIKEGSLQDYKFPTQNFYGEKEVEDIKIYLQEQKKKLLEYFGLLQRVVSDLDREKAFLPDYQAHAKAIATMLERFNLLYSEAKREEGVVDFADLEHFALKILRDQKTREEIKKQYKYIFVDEYQDINGVQEEIISSLSNDNLFMVGDVKQSIYGFRGCKPEIFQNKFKQMEKRGGGLRLNNNFRCAEKIIDFVNQVFTFSMRRDTFGEDYAQSRLIAGGVYPEGYEGRVALHHLVRENVGKVYEQPRRYDIEKEAEDFNEEKNTDLSALIADIIRDELGKKYYDFKDKKEKDIRYGDIAILTRKKDNAFVSNLAKGLIKRGIPLTSSVAQNVCDYPEVQVLISLLKIIDCYQDDVPLGSVMKSPIGGFTEEDLHDIVSLAQETVGYVDRFYKAYNFMLENEVGSLSQRVKEFHAYFEKIRFLADFKSAYEILTTVIQDKLLESHYLASRGGEKKVRRVNAFLSASHTPDKEYSVREFLKKINDDSCQITFTENDGSDSAVTLMTIHASKGLEFPVVIVCGVEEDLPLSDPDHLPVTLDREIGVSVRRYDTVTKTSREGAFGEYVKQKQKNTAVTEELRLLYVALTRAKYSLHVTIEYPETPKKNDFSSLKTFYDFFPPDTIFDKVDINKLIDDNKFIEIEGNLFGRVNQTSQSQMLKNFGYVYPYLNDTQLPLKSSVTASLRNEENDAKEIFTIEKVFEKGESTDARKGTVAHKILELFDFESDKTLRVQVNQLVKDRLLTEEDLEGVNLDCLSNSAVYLKEVIGKGKIYREQDFLVQIPASLLLDVNTDTPVLLQGIIDLMIIEDDGVKIVDYKYSKKGAEGLLSAYTKQLQLYGYAVEKVLGKKVKSKTIVNLVSGITVDVE